jgi:hypothetical protein
MVEVKAASNIEIFTVHVKVDPELLWKRIQARLALEPERHIYNEVHNQIESSYDIKGTDPGEKRMDGKNPSIL